MANGIAPNGTSTSTSTSETSETHTPSQRYLSTRGEESGLGFEQVVLKGLASDGGLFIPEAIPAPTASTWQEDWRYLDFSHLALEIFSLYISPAEIPPVDLRAIVDRSYSTFRHPDVTPLVALAPDLHLLELFHGPTFAFKDVALQFLGNLFEYFLVRRNEGKKGRHRYHLTVVGATSGDTGSAAIYGLRGKQDISVFMLHPKGRVSPVQEQQMTTVLDANVHNLAVTGNFDNCQDIVKALFGDSDANSTLRLGAVNSINWARILAQIVYYYHAYFNLVNKGTIKMGDKVRFATPTGNFGDVLAGYFAYRMGLPIEKLIVATNENDILDRFFKTGKYEKHVARGPEAEGGLAADGARAHEDGVKETLSPAMDILVSSNFERLLWFLAYEYAATAGMDEEWNRKQAGQEVSAWLRDLKTKGGFGPVPADMLAAARGPFTSERVTDAETLATIRATYRGPAAYVLDPHTAVGVEAAGRQSSGSHTVALATAHPAKFAGAVKLALEDEPGFAFDSQVPPELADLGSREKRVTDIANDWTAVRELVKARIEEEMVRSHDG